MDLHNTLEEHVMQLKNKPRTLRNVALYQINVSRLAKCAVRKPHLPLRKDKLR